MSVEVGATAPGFELSDQHGQRVALAEFRGRSSVLLVFYPFAFSGICTGELREIQANLELFAGAGVQVVGVSCDPMYSLRAYADQDGYEFPLLSDFWPHGAVAEAYGVFAEASGRAERGAFLIDREGVLRWSVVNPPGEARPLAAYQEAIAAL